MRPGICPNSGLMGKKGKGITLNELEPMPGEISSRDRINHLAVQFKNKPPLGGALPVKPTAPPSQTNSFKPLPVAPIMNAPVGEKQKKTSKNLDIGMDSNLLPTSTSNVTLSRFNKIKVMNGDEHDYGKQHGNSDGKEKLKNNPPMDDSRGRSYVPDAKKTSFSPQSCNYSARSLSRSRYAVCDGPSTGVQRIDRAKEIPGEGAGYVKVVERRPFTKAVPREEPSQREYNRDYTAALRMRPDYGWDLDIDDDDDDHLHDSHLPTVAAAEHYEWKQWKEAKSQGDAKKSIPDNCTENGSAAQPVRLAPKGPIAHQNALLAERQDARFAGHIQRSSSPIKKAEEPCTEFHGGISTGYESSTHQPHANYDNSWDNSNSLGRSSSCEVTLEALVETQTAPLSPETGQMLVTCPSCHCRFGYPPLSRINYDSCNNPINHPRSQI